MNDVRPAGGATPFPELNELLGEFVGRVEAILGDSLFGAYLVGSFALGAGDLSSDCDFLIVTAKQVTEEQERALRELHDEIPTHPGYWAINLEGSYAPRADLETLERLNREWLYIDRGWREMQWSTHCNVEDTRWILRERGIALTGPDPSRLRMRGSRRHASEEDAIADREFPAGSVELDQLRHHLGAALRGGDPVPHAVHARDRRSDVEAGVARMGEGGIVTGVARPNRAGPNRSGGAMG